MVRAFESLSLNRHRNSFSMHVEAGHNSSEPEDIPRDLRCPLCLYHTKNKSNMIDHIVLHRGTPRTRTETKPAVQSLACFETGFSLSLIANSKL